MSRSLYAPGPSSSNVAGDPTSASPFSQTPADILFTIFLACFAELKRSPPSIWGKHPIVSVSQVSRQWRDLSLGMAILWSGIEITIPPYPTRPMISALEERTDAFILRSKELPLTIRMKALTNDYLDRALAAPGLHALVKPTVETLLAHCRRWKELEVSCAGRWLEPDCPLHFVCTLKPDLVPNLECIVLDFCEEPAAHNYAPYILRCPTLGRLELKGYFSESFAKSVNWKSLAELVIGDPRADLDSYIVRFYALVFIEVQLVVDALRQCPNLVRCSLTLTSASSTPEDNDPVTIEGHVSLPRLQSLSLYGQWIPPGIASSFDLPQLTNLSVLPLTSAFSQGNVVLEWGRLFGSQLTDFTFDYASLHRAGLLVLLPLLQNVARLRVIRHELERLVDDPPIDAPRASFDREIWEGLTPKSGDEPPDGVSEGECWCPHLRVLHCVISATGRFVERRRFRGALASFIIARRTGKPRGLALLQEVKLEFDGASISKHELAHILEEAGVSWKPFTLVTFSNER